MQALSDRVHFLRADLRSVAETRRVVDVIRDRWPTVDALVLCANRQSPRRVVTDEGLEQTFALYYLSRYLLSHGLRDQLDTAERPVVVNVAGVGITRGSIHWADLQLAGGSGTAWSTRSCRPAAQLQAGRANDLLGVDFAARSGARARYVLYHPGFTRSGDLSTLPAPVRGVVRAASVFARPVGRSVHPVVAWIDDPPSAALTASDRGRPVPLSTGTLDPAAARRLGALTDELPARLDGG